MSGLWQFQLDPKEQGEAKGWFDRLPAPRSIAVPCSWNELFDDARDYLGLAWYPHQTWAPQRWRSGRVFVRVGSANYSAKVWVNGRLVTQHLGGHLPFAADITEAVAWDRPNVIAIAVENKQLPERVPAGPSPAGGLFSGLTGGYPATTYDYLPFAGLHRQVVLYSVPSTFIDDVTVITDMEGRDGIVRVRVEAAGYDGRGTLRLNDSETPLTFGNGAAEAIIRVPSARLWHPGDPYLYPLTITLDAGQQVTDAYSLEVGIRTVAVRGDQLLLNGEPVTLRGFGKHEDFPINGRGLNLPLLIRDGELLKWVGANSYRTSHYPYSEEAMQLADRLGFLVIDEIPAVSLDFNDGEDLVAQRFTQCVRVCTSERGRWTPRAP